MNTNNLWENQTDKLAFGISAVNSYKILGC